LFRWLDGDFAEGEIPSTGPEAAPIFRGIALDRGVALYHPPPRDRDLWIEKVYAACNPIHGDSLWDWASSHPVEVLGRLHTHLIERLENGGIVNLARAATEQVWNQLLSIPPLRSAAIETTLDAAVMVLQTHQISADSIQRPSTDATEMAWKERAARFLLVEALERTSTPTRNWWNPIDLASLQTTLGSYLTNGSYAARSVRADPCPHRPRAPVLAREAAVRQRSAVSMLMASPSPLLRGLRPAWS
jgi:hypothetical protein